ncbi:hydrolase, NUDIX family protein [Tritrichomonas foetus]|uniref:Hydrolase, NUDIX family protein n=1 Tax=Tritrichomonas foetus TaxID=1144522 RepID=A0A1J4JIE2_9EUKA|nr:hydrolase, NUDIX family protein [Tritrichomonas foetus]|eukprot:OHS98103.1 hydrolase, NUDIX family protein [Tritrichomonas foetus]
MRKRGSKNYADKKFRITQEQAEDIFVRFFLNTPTNKISDANDFTILLENALYYYLTVYKHDNNTVLQQKLFEELTGQLFSLIPSFNPYLPHVKALISAHFKLRDMATPCGCICYNPEMTHVLVVHHTVNTHFFSFPKGKMEEGESYMTTAARETLEETGVDVSPYINDKYMFTFSRQKRSDVVMFHVKNIPMSKHLQSPSPLEIKLVRWVSIDDVGNEDNFEPDPPTMKLMAKVREFVSSQNPTRRKKKM